MILLFLDAPLSFLEILKIIQEREGVICIREFGLGLNKGTNRYKPLNDVTAFERQIGLHISLGNYNSIMVNQNKIR